MFLALEPAETARAELARWRDELVSGRDDLRPVAADVLHVTLVFLGWQAEKDAERIASLSFDALPSAAPPLLRPAGVEPLPPRAPRLFALDLLDEGERAVALQAAVSAACASARLYRPEKRPFWPHLTLARVKRGRRAAPLQPAGLPGELPAAAVTLYRSTLRPQGALYEPLARREL